jgi:putative endopeptidase
MSPISIRNAVTALLLVQLCNTTLHSQNPGINISYIDTTIRPQNDFYNYCNGKWLKNFHLPESDARYGTFNEIHENNLVKIKRILDDAVQNKTAAPNTNAQRLRDFYMTAMDSVKADQQDFTPIQEQLQRIEKVQNLDELIALKSDFDFIGVNLFFAGDVSPDLKNSRKYCFGIGQAGYGLGDRDYYYAPQFNSIRDNYKSYLTQLFVNTGTKHALAQDMANLVFELEKQLTEKALTRVELRDIERLYNKRSQAGLSKLAPHINWKHFFATKKIAIPDSVNVGPVDYIAALDQLLSTTPLHVLQAYARAQLLMEAAPFLTHRFMIVHFGFRGRVLSGAKVMKSRWQRVQSVMDGCMGDIVSEEYVKRHFPPESKIKIDKLIDNLILSYRERIATRDWMSAPTREQANRKLDLLIRKIGYPEKWRSYEGLQIATDSYWANVCRARRFMVQDNLNDLPKPVDRKKWQMTAVTVNAYYDPTTNEITFPAAILQPPFFDPKADDAANYGTMGSIIGHELTHGFDDQGAQFDADGNMKMWWTEQDFKNFRDRTALIVKQFNEYKAIDTMRVNGSMTQGENIADLGGLTMAYYAYKKSLKGALSPVIRGYSGEQRFFIAWTQGWKQITRDEELRRLLTLDYHAPARFRGFVPLTNMKEFHTAFGVKPGDAMHRNDSEKVEIW